MGKPYLENQQKKEILREIKRRREDKQDGRFSLHHLAISGREEESEESCVVFMCLRRKKRELGREERAYFRKEKEDKIK